MNIKIEVKDINVNNKRFGFQYRGKIDNDDWSEWKEYLSDHMHTPHILLKALNDGYAYKIAAREFTKYW